MPTLVLGALALFLLMLSVPIFLAILAPTIIAFETFGPFMPSLVIGQRMVEGVNIFSLLAVPLFVFAADIISRGEIGARLVALMERLVGHVTGGVAIATTFACAVFGAISGIGVAAVVSIGPIVFPAMIRQGYSRGFTVGLILTASTLAMLIPPSVALILYGVQTSTSIAALFLGGFSAGLVFTLFLAAYCYLYAKRHGVGRMPCATLAEVWWTFRSAFWALGLPLIICVGIYGGAFTPTEAAAVSCVYAIIVETLIYRQLPWRDLIKVSSSSAAIIATLMILISAGATMTWYMTLQQVPAQIAGMLQGSSANQILAIINVIFLVAGMLIDPNSAIIVLTPLIFPAAAAAGIDPIHLGNVIVLNLAIGMVTPPFGLNLFIGILTFRLGYFEAVRSVLPFIAVALAALAVTTYVSAIVTWLPGLSSVR